ASAAITACRANFPVRVRTTSGTVHDSRGGAGEAEAVLDALSRLEPADAADSAVDSVRRIPAGGSLVLIVPSGADLHRLAAVRARFDRVVVLAVGHTPTPAPAGIAVLDVPALDDL